MNLLKTQATVELFFNWLSTEYLFLDLQWITEKSARQHIQVYEPECPSYNYKIEIIFLIWWLNACGGCCHSWLLFSTIYPNILHPLEWNLNFCLILRKVSNSWKCLNLIILDHTMLSGINFFCWQDSWIWMLHCVIYYLGPFM